MTRRIKVSVDTLIPLEDLIPLFDLMKKEGWKIFLVNNGNILFEKEVLDDYLEEGLEEQKQEKK